MGRDGSEPVETSTSSPLAVSVSTTATAVQLDDTYLRRLFDDSPAPILVLDATTSYCTDCNAAAVRFYQLPSREALVGKTLADLSPPSQYDGVSSSDRARGYLETAVNEGSVSFEWLHVHPDGSPWDAEIRMSSFESEHTKYVQCTLQDVTMCRRAEVALREREMHYRQLFELNPAPMLIYERETFHLLLVNEAFERHYGYSRAEAAELTLLDLYPVDERAKRAANFTEIHGTVLASEHHHLKRDGSPITVVAISHDVSIGGHDARFVVFTDITERLRQEAERRELESRLVQSQKMEAVGQLAGGVAHDFNNILTAILVELELLKAEPALSSNLTEGLAELTHEAERAAELTRQLLTFSRRRILKSKVVEIGSVLTNLLKMLRRLIGENIELRYDNSAGPLWLWVDPGLLEQVVVNLVVNARDAMPTGGRLNLRTYAVTVTEPSHEFCHDAYPGHFVCLSVTDNGQGMNEATIQHIFEPFFTTKAAGKGTGLGLATVYGIVKQHRGFLDVRSTPGQGSTFSIFLPALPEGQVLIESPSDHNEVQGGTENLLLVEDEKTVRHSLCGVLTNLGYRVHEASNSLEALELWDKVNGKIDLLISDIVMPGGLSGIELAVRLMMSSPLLKVLLISGYAPQDADGVLSQRPGIQVLEKPFTASTFALRVRQCLEPRVANDK